MKVLNEHVYDGLSRDRLSAAQMIQTVEKPEEQHRHQPGVNYVLSRFHDAALLLLNRV